MHKSFFARTSAIMLAASLSACATMHDGNDAAAGISSTDVRQRLGLSLDALRQLSEELAGAASSGPTVLSSRYAVALMADARAAIAGAGGVEVGRPGFAAKAEMAMLSVLLIHCGEQARTAEGMEEGSAEARRLAKSLGQHCIIPLRLMQR